MTRFDLLLGLEGPELDHSRANDDVACDRVVSQRAQNIFRTVCHTVYNRLDAIVVLVVPDLHYLVCAKTDQVISIFVNVEVRD